MRPASVFMVCCLAAAGAFGGYVASPALSRHNAAGQDSFGCHVVSVHDGDTFTCGERGADGRSIRIRLAGVDARELGDFCARGHPCSPAHADDSTAELRRLADGQALSCEANGTSYNRIAAFCSRSDGTDLSCAMLQAGMVARWDRYWGGHRC